MRSGGTLVRSGGTLVRSDSISAADSTVALIISIRPYHRLFWKYRSRGSPAVGHLECYGRERPHCNVTFDGICYLAMYCRDFRNRISHSMVPVHHERLSAHVTHSALRHTLRDRSGKRELRTNHVYNAYWRVYNAYWRAPTTRISSLRGHSLIVELLQLGVDDGPEEFLLFGDSL